MGKYRRTGFMASFDQLKKDMRKNPRSSAITTHLQILTSEALTYLADNAQLVELKSLVAEKEYFAYSIEGLKSRAINKALYCDMSLVINFLDLLRQDQVPGNISSEDITSACYTIAMSLACYIDLTNKGDRQTPGTFFEYLVTHILTCHLKTTPSSRVKVAIGDDKVSLTMDLIINIGNDKTIYHVAVKNSTRERAVEIWAHQRILDKAFGENSYTGVFIGLSETKLDHKSNEVTEICVPEQWRAYQHFIASLYAIYYVDIPHAYKELHKKPPYIPIKNIGDLYYDIQKG